jgi:NitT/TauT family transport system permease protein
MNKLDSISGTPIRLLSLLLAGLAWEGMSRTSIISPLFFPPPSVIFLSLYDLFISHTLWTHLGVTLMRMSLGLLLGGIPGILVGLGMGWSSRARVLLDPLVAALHPLPKVAILPLIMIIFGIGELSKVMAVAVAVFFPVLINSMVAVLQIEPLFFEVAKLYGAGRGKTFKRVVLPASLPMIMAGVRIALNSALLITIAVELVTARQGLGALIWLAWELFRTEELYAGLFIIGLLGVLTNWFMTQIQARLIPWRDFQSI